MSKVNNFGLETVLPRPWDSSASSSNFNTAEPVFLNIPIPLVAPAVPKLKRLSVPAPVENALVVSESSEPEPEGAPTELPP